MWLLNPYRFGDPDAAAYIAAVEAADGQVLEAAVASAITAFVVGCKTDGTWNALKASCIMAGARTLAGALVPLRGAAPTNFNFVAGDYNRKTGFKGDASTKYLDSNRNNNADPQDSNHNAAYVTEHATWTSIYMSGSASTVEIGDNNFGRAGNSIFCRNRQNQGGGIDPAPFLIGLHGTNRSSSSQYLLFPGGFVFSGSQGVSQTPSNNNVEIFAGKTGATMQYPTDARLSFYSIGEAIDLALLDARVTTLMNALAAAIP